MRVSVSSSEQSYPAASLTRYAPDLAKAMFAYGNAAYNLSRLSLREFEAARIRTAEINGCVICRGFRAVRDLESYAAVSGGGVNAKAGLLDRGPEPDEELYTGILNWRQSTCYTAREKVAIEFAERLGLAPDELPYDDEFWTRAKSLFSDGEIVDLALCVGAWMAGGRVLHALGLDTVCSAAPADMLAEVA